MSHLRRKFARFLALLAVVGGLIGAAVPPVAAMPAPSPAPVHAAMDCEHSGQHPAPARHVPGAADCCIANVCAMNLALPAATQDAVPSAYPEVSGYRLSAVREPRGIVTAPIPHPPKPAA